METINESISYTKSFNDVDVMEDHYELVEPSSSVTLDRVLWRIALLIIKVLAAVFVFALMLDKPYLLVSLAIAAFTYFAYKKMSKEFYAKLADSNE